MEPSKGPDATVVARSEFCENAALAYGDVTNPYAISIQPHPEFSDKFLTDLVNVRRGTVFDEDLSAIAVENTGKDMSRDWAARWFVDFLRSKRD